MKKLIALTLVIVSTMTSCRKFDDSLIWEELNFNCQCNTGESQS